MTQLAKFAGTLTLIALAGCSVSPGAVSTPRTAATPAAAKSAAQAPAAQTPAAVAAGSVKPGATTAAQAKTVAIAGHLNAPAGVVAQGAGNILTQDGNSYKALAVADAPLADAEVYLADGEGKPLPGIAAVRTDAKGNYRFPAAPAGATCAVVAKVRSKAGKPALMQTLVTAGDADVTADLDVATTMLSTKLLAGGKGPLGAVSTAKFQATVAVLDKALAEAGLPDLADTDALLALLAELIKQLAVLDTDLKALTEGLSQLGGKVDDLGTKIDDLAGKLDQDLGDDFPPVALGADTSFKAKLRASAGGPLPAGTQIFLVDDEEHEQAVTADAEGNVVFLLHTGKTETLSYTVKVISPAKVETDVVALNVRPGGKVSFEEFDMEFAVFSSADATAEASATDAAEPDLYRQ